LTIKSISNTKFQALRLSASRPYSISMSILCCACPPSAGIQHRLPESAILVVSIARQIFNFQRSKSFQPSAVSFQLALSRPQNTPGILPA